MSEQDLELEAFSKFIDAIEPWLGEVVLIGGWAHRLYRLHPLARRLDYLPLATLDGDVAVHRNSRRRNRPFDSVCWTPDSRKSLSAKIARRRRTTTMEKAGDSTRNF
jgi:hypothetical protein